MKSPLSKYTDGKSGGYLVGRPHSKGGIKAVVKDTGQLVELEGKEVVINKKSVQDPRKLHTFNGKRLTNKQILSEINSQDGNGVEFKDGGSIPGKKPCGCSHHMQNGGITGLSILNQDIDLLSGNKEPWMLTFDQFKRRLKDLYEKKHKARYSHEAAGIDRELKSLLSAGDAVKLSYNTHISKAIQSNDFTNAVFQGRLTWSDVKAIIESSGIPVPAKIEKHSARSFADGGELAEWYEISKMKFADAEPKVVNKDGMNVIVEPGDIVFLPGLMPSTIEEIAVWVKNPDNFYYIDRIIPKGEDDFVVIRNESTEDAHYIDLQEIEVLFSSEQKVLWPNDSFLDKIFGAKKRFNEGGEVEEGSQLEPWMLSDAAEWAQSDIHPRNIKRNNALNELRKLSMEFDFYELSGGKSVEHWINDKVLQRSDWDGSRKLRHTGIQEIDNLLQGAAKSKPAIKFLRLAKAFIQNERKGWDVNPYEFGYSYYEGQVKTAFNSGLYEMAIKEKRMTPEEVRLILSNAGLPVPADIEVSNQTNLREGGELDDENRPLQLSDIPKEVKTFLPIIQQRALVGIREGEMRKELEVLKNIIKEMPKSYQTNNIPVKNKIVWLHYFSQNMDYYIIEKDMEPEQLQAYGYTTDGLYGDWGYISIEELKATNKVELDLYFKPVRFGELMGSDESRTAHDAEIVRATSMEPVIITDHDREVAAMEIESDPFNNPTEKYSSKDEFVNAVVEHVERLYPNNFPRGLIRHENIIREKIGKFFMTTTPSIANIKTYAGIIWDYLSKKNNTTEDDPLKNPERYNSKKEFLDAVTSKVMGQAEKIRDEGKWHLTQPDVAGALSRAKAVWDEFIAKKDVPTELSSQATTITKRQQAEINTQVKDLVKEKGTDPANYSAQEIALLKLYAGAGGLSKHGETGARLLDQFYTPMDISAKMWGLAIKWGFRFPNSNVLEPSVGTGNFLQFIPSDVSVNVVAYDVDEISYKICKVLFPQYDIRHKSFESMFFTGRRHVGLAGVDQFFDLVIGNPPYRDYISEFAPLGEREATGAFSFEMYFIMRGVDVLKSGGLLVMIIPNSFLSNDNKYNNFKDELARKADLIDAYRLPNGVFKFTDVGTDIIVLKKK